jgi:hypothetical protein
VQENTRSDGNRKNTDDTISVNIRQTESHDLSLFVPTEEDVDFVTNVNKVIHYDSS